ncbi:MAG: PDZ domain-containing protein [Bacteroidales bacterium]|nr:PDZ domain-containing protein [Bacteroidales bacterium]
MKKQILVLMAALFFVFGGSLSAQTNKSYDSGKRTMDYFLSILDRIYVDTLDFDMLAEKGVKEMVTQLDPHSTYTTAKDVAASREPLKGSFDGIGVTFQIVKDTINVVEVIIDGPSEKVGILPGDKIVKVDTLKACGKHINNNWVRDHLRGDRGTKVRLSIKRGHNPDLLEFTVTRGKIPMYSINVSFMIDEKTGYIKLDRFAQTSLSEFQQHFKKLKEQGMEDLIFDLRGNGGGYLNTAFQIASQFIDAGCRIVYTDNFRKTGEHYDATPTGLFRKGKLIVLVDENSASASEITAGAIQDWDRGLIMGRRTFGKGLVQKPVDLPSGAEVRVTISHYYTPSGRCIQKPYDDRNDYFRDIATRYKHGEMFSADSIAAMPDSLKFETMKRHRTVYGGGGIMPDLFVPMDTTHYAVYYNDLVRRGVISTFVMDYLDANRAALKNQYPTFEQFKQNFQISDKMYNELTAFAKKEGVVDSAKLFLATRLEVFAEQKENEIDSLYNSIDDLKNLEKLNQMLTDFVKESYQKSVSERNSQMAPQLIKTYMLFELARNLYGYGDAYRYILEDDATFLKACEVMKDDKVFRKYKVDRN